jgi:acetyl esterase/lipase
MPYYGLSLHKPSTLWPPPPNLITTRVRESLKSRIRRVVQLDKYGRLKPSVKDDIETGDVLTLSSQGLASSPASPDHSGSPDQVVDDETRMFNIKTKAGEVVTVETQIQLYVPNDLLNHPWVSPVGAYLGGLPPLFFIAGDKEVLRDEIIYTYVLSQTFISVTDFNL